MIMVAGVVTEVSEEDLGRVNLVEDAATRKILGVECLVEPMVSESGLGRGLQGMMPNVVGQMIISVEIAPMEN